MSNKVWNLMYRMGAGGRVIGAADNPVTRKVAADGAAVITRNGWRAWIEHHKSGEIVYQNPAEVEYQQALADEEKA